MKNYDKSMKKPIGNPSVFSYNFFIARVLSLPDDGVNSEIKNVKKMQKTIRIKKIRIVLFIVDNFAIKRHATSKSNKQLEKDCIIRTKNTGNKTSFVILPERYY